VRHEFPCAEIRDKLTSFRRRHQLILSHTWAKKNFPPVHQEKKRLHHFQQNSECRISLRGSGGVSKYGRRFKHSVDRHGDHRCKDRGTTLYFNSLSITPRLRTRGFAHRQANKHEITCCHQRKGRQGPHLIGYEEGRPTTWDISPWSCGVTILGPMTTAFTQLVLDGGTR
jgi:hypothetical protein